jgi:TetR/AcrR family transcriptional regulator
MPQVPAPSPSVTTTTKRAQMAGSSDVNWALLVLAETPDEQTKRILSASRTQISRHGIRRTSMEDLARAAGISRTTLYSRFPNKEAILRALMIRELQTYSQQVEQILSHKPLRPEALEDVFVLTIQLTADNPFFQGIREVEPESLTDLWQVGDASGPLRIGVELLASLFAPHIESGSLAPVDPLMLAEFFTRLVITYTLAPYIAVDSHDEAVMRTMFRSLVLESVATKPSKRPRRSG